MAQKYLYLRNQHQILKPLKANTIVFLRCTKLEEHQVKDLFSLIEVLKVYFFLINLVLSQPALNLRHFPVRKILDWVNIKNQNRNLRSQIYTQQANFLKIVKERPLSHSFSIRTLIHFDRPKKL